MEFTMRILLIIVVLWSSVVAANEAGFMEVRNPQRLPADKIPCERIQLGELEDYKPSIGLLPSGELLLTMFNGHRKENGKIFEQVLLCRSTDGGKSWSKSKKLALLGREPSLTILKDGTIFITTHLLTQEVRNKDGYTHSYVHRSGDEGRTWTTTKLQPKSFRPRVTGLTTRNVLELADGSLMLGISEHGVKNCRSVVLLSTDHGKTWSETYAAEFDNVPKDYPFTLFGEAHLWQARSGKIYAILRVGSGNSWPLAGIADPGNNDQSERMIIYSSAGGKNWSKVSDLGSYGQMYMSLLRLGSDRLLLTFTQRDISPPLGVRGVLGVESKDGFEFDMNQDLIMLDTKTPVGVKSGGGFGPTVQLADGTLVTSYTWRGVDNQKRAEVVRWRLPKLK